MQLLIAILPLAININCNSAVCNSGEIAILVVNEWSVVRVGDWGALCEPCEGSFFFLFFGVTSHS